MKESRTPLILKVGEQQIFGVIHRPVTSEKYPVVVMCHGLGGHKIGKFRLYVDLAESLAALGIASLRFDFRGAGDSEGNFAEMNIDSQMEDAAEALRYVNNDPNIDSERIGLFGRSFGGAIALLSALRCTDLKALAVWSPVFSGEPWAEKWEALQNAPLSPEQKERMMQVNGMRPGISFFKQLFSLDLTQTLLQLHHLPFLHISGEKDQLVSSFHTDKFREGRRDAMGETTFLRYPETDHDFSHYEERLDALDKTLNWFQHYLQPKVP